MFLAKLCLFLAAICAAQSARCENRMKIINTNFVDKDDKEVILAVHNQVRSMISSGDFGGQPQSAQPLPDLEWDEKLAAEAKKVTKTCTFAHSLPATSNYTCVGQNIWIAMTAKFNTTIDWTLPVIEWMKEAANFQYPLTALNNAVTGHYTQLVWAKTTNVGCAAIQYVDDLGVESDDKKNNYFVVCNYGPCGNTKNEPPYEEA